MQEDEPEAHGRPLQFDDDAGVPHWYQTIVNTCLAGDPKLRVQALQLLRLFPAPDRTPDGWGPQSRRSNSVDDGTSAQGYSSNDYGGYGGAVVTTVQPRDDWSSDVSHTYVDPATGMSNEPYYFPTRGRSPARPRDWSRPGDTHDFHESSAVHARGVSQQSDEKSITPKTSKDSLPQQHHHDAPVDEFTGAATGDADGNTTESSVKPGGARDSTPQIGQNEPVSQGVSPPDIRVEDEGDGQAYQRLAEDQKDMPRCAEQPESSPTEPTAHEMPGPEPPAVDVANAGECVEANRVTEEVCDKVIALEVSGADGVHGQAHPILVYTQGTTEPRLQIDSAQDETSTSIGRASLVVEAKGTTQNDSASTRMGDQKENEPPQLREAGAEGLPAVQHSDPPIATEADSPIDYDLQGIGSAHESPTADHTSQDHGALTEDDFKTVAPTVLTTPRTATTEEGAS